VIPEELAMPSIILSPTAASLFNTTLLTALLEHCVATGKLTKSEVAGLLVACRDNWTDRDDRVRHRSHQVHQ
jgi:hypothetical protein